MKIQATNAAVWVKRDEVQTVKKGLIMPTGAQVKPHEGIILSVGNLVQDKDIKKGVGKKCLWHPTVGMEIEYEEEIYLVLRDIDILGVL